MVLMRWENMNEVCYAPGRSCFQLFLENRARHPENDVLQIIFLNENEQKFFDALEERVLPKILRDIETIMGKRWALKISPESLDERERFDFYHCPILGDPNLKISGQEKDFKEDMRQIVSSASILYHTRENRNQNTLPEHSVYCSSLDSEPVTVDPAIFRGKPNGAVNYTDLGRSHLAQINFRLAADGAYALKDGTRLDFVGILLCCPSIRKSHDSQGNKAVKESNRSSISRELS